MCLLTQRRFSSANDNTHDDNVRQLWRGCGGCSAAVCAGCRRSWAMERERRRLQPECPVGCQRHATVACLKPVVGVNHIFGCAECRCCGRRSVPSACTLMAPKISHVDIFMTTLLWPDKPFRSCPDAGLWLLHRATFLEEYLRRAELTTKLHPPGIEPAGAAGRPTRAPRVLLLPGRAIPRPVPLPAPSLAPL